MPARLIIKFITCLKEHEVQEIDPEFSKNIIRLPLLLYPLASGLLSSITTSLIKGVSELMNSSEIWENVQKPMPYLLLILVGTILVSQLHFMNLSLKYYD